jgi:hypothetical protein
MNQRALGGEKMSSKNKAVRDLHAKMYIDAVFAETLTQEGFINPDGKSISWYRVVNNELIHAVYFHATWGRIPVDGMKIESRIYSPYSKPHYYSEIYTKGSNRHFGYRVMCIDDIPQPGRGKRYGVYTDDVLVYTIKDGKQGLYTLEHDILPWFQKGTSLNAYYVLITEEACDRTIPFSEHLLAEAAILTIYYGDTEMYKYYSKRLGNAIPYYVDEKKKENLIATKAVLDGGNRDEFLQNLEVQKAKNIKWMKKMSINIG